ncbi:MAG: hypothetical protein IH840_16260 [Candidatus Heimdallarchaeota archaeon]|nr:hypothetical protein [Candidatus Heimdallarchaeota archaeon]
MKKLYNVHAVFVRTSFPESCVDLDYLEDLQAFEEYVKKPTRKLTKEDTVEVISKIQ